MTIFAGTTLIAQMINRWRAHQSMAALVRRRDDHFLDDIGVTRDELNQSFGSWRRQMTSPAAGRGGVLPARTAAIAPGRAALAVARMFALPRLG